jgi:hypothetical protein
MGSLFQFLGMPIGRENGHDPLAWKELPYSADRRSEVAVARQKESCIKRISVGIAQELDGDVHISHLFAVPLRARAAKLASHRLRLIFSIGNIEIRQRAEGFKVCGLALLFINRVRDAGGEILDSHQLLIGLDNLLDEALDIKPVEVSPSLATDAKIEVVPVHICDDSIHLHPYHKIEAPPVAGGARPTIRSLGLSFAMIADTARNCKPCDIFQWFSLNFPQKGGISAHRLVELEASKEPVSFRWRGSLFQSIFISREERAPLWTILHNRELQNCIERPTFLVKLGMGEAPFFKCVIP